MTRRKHLPQHSSTHRVGIATLLLLMICSVAAPARAREVEAQIRWTRYGIPHVKATDYAGLGLGYGYAVARDELCVLADAIVTVRGERSRWFGADKETLVGFVPASNLDSDLFYRVQLADADVESAWQELSAQARDLAAGYAAGYNLFINELARESRAAGCNGAPLADMRGTDVLRFMMQIGAIWRAHDIAPFASGSTRERLTTPTRNSAAEKHEDPIGSNAWAYGSDVTGTGAAIVVANPHTSWMPSWQRMHQLHLTIPGELDVAGADFAGLPVPVAGFTKDIAWTLKSPIGMRYHVLLALDVTDGDKPYYMVDGQRRPISFKPVRLDARDADGRVRSQTFHIPYTDLGPIYRLSAAAGRAAGWYALTDPNLGNALGIDQFLGVAKAPNVQEMRSAVERHRGLTARLIAGDRHGEVLYIEAGPLLDVEDSALRACAVDTRYREGRVAGAPAVLDGSRNACALRNDVGAPRLAAASKIPSVSTRGAVQFASTSNRYALFGRMLGGYSILFGDSHEPPGARALMSERHLVEALADRRITIEEATDVMFSNRNYAAETALDAILNACERAEASSRAHRACNVLKAWNRHNDRDSRGALLFGAAWPHISEIPGLHAERFDPDRPYQIRAVSTAPGIGDAILTALDAAMTELNAVGLEGDEPWGQMLARATNHGRVPLHGGTADEGVLNVLSGGPLRSDGYADVRYGSSYAHVVTWNAGKLEARVLLAHGQSIDPASPHFADQLPLFAQKRLETMPFTDAEIETNLASAVKKVRGRVR